MNKWDYCATGAASSDGACAAVQGFGWRWVRNGGAAVHRALETAPCALERVTQVPRGEFCLADALSLAQASLSRGDSDDKVEKFGCQ